MKNLFNLILRPTQILGAHTRVPALLMHILALCYLLIGGFVFQFLYPRLLDKMPFLGTMRKLAFWNGDSVFNMNLFLRGLGMCVILLVVFIFANLLISTISKTGKGKGFMASYNAGVTACIPVFLTTIAAFFLFPVHFKLGLFPVYGLLAATCLQFAILREHFGLWRSWAMYVAPLVLGVQLYGAYLLKP